MDRAAVAIIGGGVVGCAIARALAEKHEDVFLLEALPKIGMLTSTRNSGVIHAGLYYRPGSLKAQYCVRGNRLTYEFCAKHGVPHRKTGKLVVATSPAESSALAALYANARKNGVEGMELIDRAGIRAREPHIEGFEAIYVPSTGILSSEELVKAYARVATDRGANIVTRARVTKLEPAGDVIRIASEAGQIEARCVINSAGLFADDVAAMLGSKMAGHKIHPVRGEYCELARSKNDWVNGLVYPLPPADGKGIGIHLTKTLWGTVLVGPTARDVKDKNDYEKNRLPLEYFAEEIRSLLPGLDISDFSVSYSGIRPKLGVPADGSSHGHGMVDFLIERDPDIPRTIHLMGIESPGLTAAPAIAERVAALVDEIVG
jgi:L-2-hydroxyglutarate oxidase LhgO